MNIARIYVAGRVEEGPIATRHRNLITIIRDGRPMTGRAAPKRKRSK